MSDSPFGLYRSRGLASAQRLVAGQVLSLDTPVLDGGVALFRASCWLPLPPQLASAQAVRLAPSVLQVRFAALRLDVGTGDTAWFPKVRHLDSDTVRIEFTWPAQVVRVRSPTGGVRHAIELLRADGDAVAEKATMNAQTGIDLPEPWVGSPLVVRVGEPIFAADLRADTVGGVLTRAAAPGPGFGTGPVATGASSNVVARIVSTGVPGLTLAGVPTSPSLKLFAVQPDDAATLLWQGMLPGEQGTVTLPLQAVDVEWTPAFEQLLKLAADPETAPTLLRLDIESDAPCTATFAELALLCESETELLTEPWRADFGGGQPEQRTLAIVGATALGESLSLMGRVVADNEGSADGGASATDSRYGALLAEGDAALQPIELSQPMSLAGLALQWQPLSDALRLRVRLLADAATGPGTQVLAEAELALDTPQETWLTPRWLTVDLQPRKLWIEATVTAGMGLWLFGGSGGSGWIETRAATTSRTLLPQALATATIATANEGATARPIAVRLGNQTLAATLTTGALSLSVPKAMLASLAWQPLLFTGSVRATVTVESARLVTRSA